MVLYDVLLVDDDEISIDMARRILMRAGFTVATARDGAQAISLLSQNTIGVIVTDIEMPVLDGLALLRWLRGSPTLSALPALALTGHSDRRSICDILSCGADDYILKPFAPSLLIEAVGRFAAPSGSASACKARNESAA